MNDKRYLICSVMLSRWLPLIVVRSTTVCRDFPQVYYENRENLRSFYSRLNNLLIGPSIASQSLDFLKIPKEIRRFHSDDGILCKLE